MLLKSLVLLSVKHQVFTWETKELQSKSFYSSGANKMRRDGSTLTAGQWEAGDAVHRLYTSVTTCQGAVSSSSYFELFALLMSSRYSQFVICISWMFCCRLWASLLLVHGWHESKVHSDFDSVFVDCSACGMSVKNLSHPGGVMSWGSYLF